jgi:hypothetical protein
MLQSVHIPVQSILHCTAYTLHWTVCALHCAVCVHSAVQSVPIQKIQKSSQPAKKCRLFSATTGCRAPFPSATESRLHLNNVKERVSVANKEIASLDSTSQVFFQKWAPPSASYLFCNFRFFQLSKRSGGGGGGSFVKKTCGRKSRDTFLLR